MSWKKWTGMMGQGISFILKAAELEVFKVEIIDSKTEISIDRTAANKFPYLLGLVNGVVSGGGAMVAQFYTWGKVMTEGPKIFRPKNELIEALEDIDVNVALKEWAQPFDTMVVEFPEEFSRRLVADCPQAGTFFPEVPSLGVLPETHQVDYVIVHHEPKLSFMILGIQMSSGQFMVRIMTKKDEDLTLQELVELTSRNNLSGSIPSSEEETKVVNRACYAALNATQYLMEFGCKSHSSNPKQEARFKHFLKVAYRDKKGQQKIQEAKANLKSLPYYLTPEKTVDLYEDRTDSSRDTKTGRVLPPHVRRGHYQNYWIGVGEDKKKVRKIKRAQRINFHLLAPGQQQPTVVYRTHSDKLPEKS